MKKTYQSCLSLRRQIDKLLEQNASYQAQNNCEGNTKTQQKEINRYCNKNFIRPIKDLDPEFYEAIVKQND